METYQPSFNALQGNDGAPGAVGEPGLPGIKVKVIYSRRWWNLLGK